MDKLALRRAISEGLASWLTFEKQCGRDALFSERYLAYPIAQILAKHTTGKIVGEHNHPILAKSGKQGRPPQLDFVIEEQIGGDSKVSLVVESKWALDKGVSVADVLWDCVRLELAANLYKCDAIFILAGLRSKIDQILNSTSLNPKTSRGKPAQVLRLNGKGRFSINLQSPKSSYGKTLHKIFNEYPEVKFPRSFVCSEGSQIPKDPSSNAYTAVVWHISPESNKRFTFHV